MRMRTAQKEAEMRDESERERANNITGAPGSSTTCSPQSPGFLQMSQYNAFFFLPKFYFIVVRTFNMRSTFLRVF